MIERYNAAARLWGLRLPADDPALYKDIGLPGAAILMVVLSRCGHDFKAKFLPGELTLLSGYSPHQIEEGLQSLSKNGVAGIAYEDSGALLVDLMLAAEFKSMRPDLDWDLALSAFYESTKPEDILPDILGDDYVEPGDDGIDHAV